MKKLKRIAALCAGIIVMLMLVASCDKELDVQQAYRFELETMPVQKRIAVGETAEIRCTLLREGEYDDARYTIRYFQPDGRGELRMDDGTVFRPNDRYSLDRFSFRLYYPSRSDDQQTVDVYIEDNMGQTVQKSFTFQNDSEACELRCNRSGAKQELKITESRKRKEVDVRQSGERPKKPSRGLKP